MFKRISVIVIVVIALGVVGYLVRTKQKIVAPDPRNATYTIEGEPLTLMNGYSEKEIDAYSVSKVITQYFGNEVKADFNNDGIEDIAFLLIQNSGGSGVFFYVTVALGQENGVRGTNALLLGDRIAPQTTEFRDGDIIVNYADRKAEESMIAPPSAGVSRYFRIQDGVLVETNE